MIYWFNEARNIEEYRAEKAAREKAEHVKKRDQYLARHYQINKPNLVYKTRADGHEDSYHTAEVGSRNRDVLFDIGRTKVHVFDDKDLDREMYANRVADRNAKSRKERNEFNDAVNRNMRRHPERWDGNKPVKPKTESTIFDDVEMI